MYMRICVPIRIDIYVYRDVYTWMWLMNACMYVGAYVYEFWYLDQKLACRPVACNVLDLGCACIELPAAAEATTSRLTKRTSNSPRAWRVKVEAHQFLCNVWCTSKCTAANLAPPPQWLPSEARVPEPPRRHCSGFWGLSMDAAVTFTDTCTTEDSKRSPRNLLSG